MFAAEYRSDYSSGLHWRVIKIQRQTERYCTWVDILVQPTALITTQYSAPTWSDGISAWLGLQEI